MTQDVSEDLAGLLSDLREHSGAHRSGSLRVGMDEVRLIVSALAALQSERAARLRVEAALERETLARIIEPWAMNRAECDPQTEEIRNEALAKADLIRASALAPPPSNPKAPE